MRQGPKENSTYSEQSVNNKHIKAGAGYIIGNYLLKGITFLSAPIFTRLLTVDEFGEFGAYISYESILYIIIGLALHSSITNAKYDYKEKFDEYVSSIILLSCISVAGWLVAVNLLFSFVSPFLNMSRSVTNILVLHCFGTAMFQVYITYVGISYRVKSYLTLTAVNALSNMGLSILLILTVFSNDHIMGRIIGTAFPIFAIAIYIIWVFFKKSKPVVKREYWKYGLFYSLPIIPHGISQVILASFDRIMIRDMVGAAQAGIYSFAYTVHAIVSVVSTSLDKVWKPWFYERMNDEDYDSIRKQATKYVLGMAMFIALIFFVTPEIIMILGDKEYWGATKCVIPVVTGGFFSFIYTIPVYVEYYHKKTKYIAAGSMLAAAVNVILNYIFIPRYGYIAAAYTTLATYLAYFTFHYLMAKRIQGKSLFSGLELYGISAGLIIIGVVAMLLEKNIIARLAIELVMGAACLIWADKNFNIIGMVKNKLKKG